MTYVFAVGEPAEEDFVLDLVKLEYLHFFVDNEHRAFCLPVDFAFKAENSGGSGNDLEQYLVFDQ